MDPSLLGWRDLILLLVVIAAVYMVVMVLKLTRLRPSRTAFRTSGPAASPRQEADRLPKPPVGDGTEPTISPEAAMSAYAEALAEVPPPPPEKFAAPMTPTFEWDDVKDLFGEAGATVSHPKQPAPATPPRRGGFGEHLAEHLARSDLEMEIQRMRDEMARMHREMEELRASRRVSPQYAEAMELSQRGFTAQDVADRLGISLAEAELVQALARGKRNFD